MTWSVTQKFARKDEAIRFICDKQGAHDGIPLAVSNAIARVLRSLPLQDPGIGIQLHTSGHQSFEKPTQASVRIEISYIKLASGL